MDTDLLPLQAETSYFDAHRAEWIAAGREGQRVVVHGTELLGFYPTVAEGYAAGFERWRHDPFLVTPVTPSDEIVTIWRL